jgi:hypothetical protein
MKKSFLTILLTTISVVIFAQQKNYSSKTIGQWDLEKFPLHYLVTPAKVMTYKNQITGKLEIYEEQNTIGQTNGLKMIMSSDGIYPENAIYIYKGVIVYSAHYFPSSKIARQITTYNEKGENDGYTITRTLKSTGGYSEIIEKYENDELIELNGVKQAPSILVFVDSLLNGNFKFKTSRNWVIEGIAENGKLKKIKQSQEGGLIFMYEIEFSNDSITIKEPFQSKNGINVEKLPLKSNPLITNSKNYCLKYGNYNGYPYLFMGKDFDIRDLKVITTQIFAKPLETKVSFVDSLLNGDFQFREYIYRNNFEYEGVITYTGKAEKGNLKFLRVRKVEFDPYSGTKSSDKAFEYTFQDSKILLNEFVPELPNEPVSTKTLNYIYPVLLTNSTALGGFYSYNYSNTNNVLGVPIKRKAILKNNTYGYVYFSPTTFDISNYISIVTTKTDKPFVQKINYVNGFLDGDFDFKEDRIQFTGKANSGIVETLRIKCDFETSKDIIAPGTSLNGKTIYYDVKDVVLNNDSYIITYIKSSSNEKIFEENIPLLKNKKITTSSNLSTYENFAYCSTYKDLRNTFFNLYFFIKK